MLVHRTASPVLRDIGLLVARVLVGVVLIAHGWQKLHDVGISATADMFDASGVPMPTVAAWYAALVELLGGAALLVGALTAVAGLLVVLDMAGAFWFVHRTEGLFAPTGWELVAMIATVSLALAAAGAGRISVDRLVGRAVIERSGAALVGDTSGVVEPPGA